VVPHKKKSSNKASNSRVNHVRNVSATEYKGIKFRSKLEAYTYKALLEAKLPVEYESKRFTLLPAFKFQGKSIRAWTYTPDFITGNYIIETKGLVDAVNMVKWKMLKYLLLTTNNEHIQFRVVRNQKQVNELIQEIIQYNKSGRNI
jgi:hypothetical protein